LQSSSGNQHHQPHNAKTKTKKTKSPKRTARSDGERSPPPTRTRKSKKKKVASAERAPSSEISLKSKDVVALDTEDKLLTADSVEPTKSLSAADNSEPSPRATKLSSSVAAVSSKTVGPRTPPGPEPMSVSIGSYSSGVWRDYVMKTQGILVMACETAN